MEESHALELRLIDLPNLRRLAASEAVHLDGMQVFDGALPPAHVAARALAQIDRGMPAEWCAPFLIVSRNAVLGACTFKAAPVEGMVEIGYGVAASQRGRGVATRAIRRLLDIATASGRVREVVAYILPDNVASSTVVSRLGFSKGDPVADHDGEKVVVWTYRIG